MFQTFTLIKKPLFFLAVIILLGTQCTSKISLNPTNNKYTPISLRSDIVEFASQYIDESPYRYGGKNPKTGFDCSGFVYYVMDKFDISVTPVSYIQATEGKPTSIQDIQLADLLCFKRTKDSKVFHVGIVSKITKEGIYIVHSTSSRGVVEDNIHTNTYWKTKIVLARNVVGE